VSYTQYKNGEYVTSWDFECPECSAQWNNEDPASGDGGGEFEEECPGCHKVLLVTAEYSVDYDLRVKEPVPQSQT
jgi:hypothetical protein